MAAASASWTRAAFAGEGILDSIQPGERRIISYAADLAVQVAAGFT